MLFHMALSTTNDFISFLIPNKMIVPTVSDEQFIKIDFL